MDHSRVCMTQRAEDTPISPPGAASSAFFPFGGQDNAERLVFLVHEYEVNRVAPAQGSGGSLCHDFLW